MVTQFQLVILDNKQENDTKPHNVDGLSGDEGRNGSNGGAAAASSSRPKSRLTVGMALDLSDGFVATRDVADLVADGGALPIFDVERVQLQFSIAADFVAAQVANNVLILALSNGRLLRIDLNHPEDIDGTFGVPTSPHPPSSKRMASLLTRSA